MPVDAVHQRSVDAAVVDLKKHGGRFIRMTGGLWRPPAFVPGHEQVGDNRVVYAGAVIDELLLRGLVRVTKRDSHQGWPVEIELMES